jgi:hypothetical protein
MAVLAVLVPFVLLGILLALGWYEDALLPPEENRAKAGAQQPATSSPVPAGTPAPSP